MKHWVCRFYFFFQGNLLNVILFFQQISVINQLNNQSKVLIKKIQDIHLHIFIGILIAN
jgi:hypothetical protein